MHFCICRMKHHFCLCRRRPQRPRGFWTFLLLLSCLRLSRQLGSQHQVSGWGGVGVRWGGVDNVRSPWHMQLTLHWHMVGWGGVGCLRSLQVDHTAAATLLSFLASGTHTGCYVVNLSCNWYTQLLHDSWDAVHGHEMVILEKVCPEGTVFEEA